MKCSSHNGICVQRGPGGKERSRGQLEGQSSNVQVMVGEEEERRKGKFKSQGRGKTMRLLSLEGAEVLEVDLEDVTCPPIQSHFLAKADVPREQCIMEPLTPGPAGTGWAPRSRQPDGRETHNPYQFFLGSPVCPPTLKISDLPALTME